MQIMLLGGKTEVISMKAYQYRGVETRSLEWFSPISPCQYCLDCPYYWISKRLDKTSPNPGDWWSHDRSLDWRFQHLQTELHTNWRVTSPVQSRSDLRKPHRCVSFLEKKGRRLGILPRRECELCPYHCIVTNIPLLTVTGSIGSDQKAGRPRDSRQLKTLRLVSGSSAIPRRYSSLSAKYKIQYAWCSIHRWWLQVGETDHTQHPWPHYRTTTGSLFSASIFSAEAEASVPLMIPATTLH